MSDDPSLDRADRVSVCRLGRQARARAEVDALGERVIEVLRTVYDPEIPVNIFELGLIYKVDIDDDNHVQIDMTLTSPACPVAGTLPGEVERQGRGDRGRRRRHRRGGLGSALEPEHDDRGSPARARHDLLSRVDRQRISADSVVGSVARARGRLSAGARSARPAGRAMRRRSSACRRFPAAFRVTVRPIRLGQLALERARVGILARAAAATARRRARCLPAPGASVCRTFRPRADDRLAPARRDRAPPAARGHARPTASPRLEQRRAPRAAAPSRRSRLAMWLRLLPSALASSAWVWPNSSIRRR